MLGLLVELRVCHLPVAGLDRRREQLPELPGGLLSGLVFALRRCCFQRLPTRVAMLVGWDSVNSPGF